VIQNKHNETDGVTAVLFFGKSHIIYVEHIIAEIVISVQDSSLDYYA
jgi:hypothetical protein